jgi:leader peptidase (prepilin peptidase)/N-methyltransferase
VSASGARAGAAATPLRARLALAAAAAAVLVASFAASPGLRGALGAALGGLMLAVARSDARRFVVPDALTAPAFALGLLDASLADGGGFQAPALAAATAALAAAALLAVELVYRRLRGRAGLGLGDVKLAGVAGAWLGVALTPAAIELAALAALAAYLMRQARKRRALNRAARLPFATFFAPAIWLAWLFATRFPPP